MCVTVCPTIIFEVWPISFKDLHLCFSPKRKERKWKIAGLPVRSFPPLMMVYLPYLHRTCVWLLAITYMCAGSKEAFLWRYQYNDVMGSASCIQGELNWQNNAIRISFFFVFKSTIYFRNSWHCCYIGARHFSSKNGHEVYGRLRGFSTGFIF